MSKTSWAFKYLSQDEALRALYIDFEGAKGRPPVYLGVMGRGRRKSVAPHVQSHMPHEAFTFAGDRPMSLAAAVESVVQRAEAKNRRIVSWTEYDRVVAGLLLGVPIAVGAAYLSCRLIAAGWSACGDAEPPYLFALLFLYLPAIACAAWIGWTAVIVVTRRAKVWQSALVASLVVLLVGYLPIVTSVPMNAPEYYAAAEDDPALETCGPGGVPTWWPAWVPI